MRNGALLFRARADEAGSGSHRQFFDTSMPCSGPLVATAAEPSLAQLWSNQGGRSRVHRRLRDPQYPGSFACYCEQGELYHPIGCTATKHQLFDRWAQATLVEYAACGLSVILVPASLDGDQRYVFDASGKLVGERVTSDHGPPCVAGETVGSACVVSSCTQKTPDSPACPMSDREVTGTSGLMIGVELGLSYGLSHRAPARSFEFRAQLDFGTGGRSCRRGDK